MKEAAAGADVGRAAEGADGRDAGQARQVMGEGEGRARAPVLGRHLHRP